MALPSAPPAGTSPPSLTEWAGDVHDTVVDHEDRIGDLESAPHVQTIVEGDDITVDATDTSNPIVGVTPGSFATAAQGATADTAVQPGDLADVATSGAYADLSGLPTLGTAAAANTGDFDAAGAAAAAQAFAIQRANHTGTQSADTLTDGTTNKAFLATERTKLAGIEALADVTDAANVAAAGAVMEADTSTASMLFVIDEDNMVSDSATKVPTQQSVKAYVDASVGSGGIVSIVEGTSIDVDDTDPANPIVSVVAADFDPAGAAAAAQAASQPLDSDLTAFAALTPSNDDFVQRKAGAWTNRTVAQVKTDLGLAGSNSGDQTITLTGDVTGSGTGSFATTLKNTGPGATGPLGSASTVAVVTIDAQGRVTGLTSATIAIPESAVTNLVTDLAAKAPLASPALTGSPTAPTQTAADNSTKIATTAYADAKVAESITNGVTGIAPSQDQVFDALALKAPLASPALTGTPTAPTAAQGTDTTQVATTAMVQSEATLLAPKASPTFTGTPAAPTAAQGTNTTQLATTAMVQSEVALLAPKASPTFTGTPAAPTAAPGTSTTQLATTAFVAAGAAPLASQLKATAVKTANYTAVAGDYVPVDTTSGVIVVTLPTAPADGTIVAVKRVIGATNAVTVNTAGADVFNVAAGSTSASVAVLNQQFIFRYRATGAIWYVETSMSLGGLDGRYQPLDADLTALAGLTSAADALPYFSGAGTAAVTTLTAAARTVLDDTTVAAMLATMGGAPLASPALTGSPTAPTQSAADNSTKLATTAYVDAKVADAINDGTTGIAPSQNAVFDALALKAPLASPALTGTPSAPTAVQGTSTTQIATTAMVASEVALLAPKASPALTGNPTTPNQSAGTNNTRIANTAYVDAIVADAINDGTTGIAPSQNAVFDALALKAPLASPTLTGTPAAPTAAAGTSTTQVATTAFVQQARAPRVTSIASSATPTYNTDTTELVSITALAAAITSMVTNKTGTPVDGQKLVIRIKDNGTARAITWGADFEPVGVALPTTTVISKRLVVGFIYDSVAAKWGCVASVQEA